MAKTDLKTISGYLEKLPPATQKVLQRVRAVIHKAVPGAEEGISYSIPVFRLNGEMVIFFAGWKEHWSLYPATLAEIVTLAKKAGYPVTKGTVKFSLSEPVPEAFVAKVAKLRARDAIERAEVKALAKARKKATKKKAKR